MNSAKYVISEAYRLHYHHIRGRIIVNQNRQTTMKTLFLPFALVAMLLMGLLAAHFSNSSVQPLPISGSFVVSDTVGPQSIPGFEKKFIFPKKDPDIQLDEQAMALLTEFNRREN